MMKILIVDDKPDNLYLLEAILDGDEFQTVKALNGAEAWELMQNETPDMIISDILMPVMDGFTLCRHCKKDESFRHIPFFFYTATYTDARDEEYALSLGADRFILKPQEPVKFLKIIYDFLEEVKDHAVKEREIIQQPEEYELKEYNEVLIRKIEDKMIQTEKSERELRVYATRLENEISERIKTEQALRESRQLFQTLALVSPVGIFRTNAEGRTTYVNPQWCELSGLSPEQALDDNWIHAVHPDDRQRVLESWYKDINTIEHSSSSYRFLRNDGRIIWVIGNAVPEILDGEIIGYVGTITDITAMKNVEAELIKAKEKAEVSDKLKTAFLNSISHEIRTPMNGILGFAELLKEPDLEGEEQKKYIEMIEQSSERMLNIITDIVDISRIVSGEISISNSGFDLKVEIDNLISEFQIKAAEKGLRWINSSPVPLAPVTMYTDKGKLVSILTKILSNAVKFTSQGFIEFGYSFEMKETGRKYLLPSTAEYITFFVKDTGIGIPQDKQATIFERFARADIEDKFANQGVGLGLSIAQSYAGMLGGKITVESEPGKGSIFWLTIPCK